MAWYYIPIFFNKLHFVYLFTFSFSYALVDRGNSLLVVWIQFVFIRLLLSLSYDSILLFNVLFFTLLHFQGLILVVVVGVGRRVHVVWAHLVLLLLINTFIYQRYLPILPSRLLFGPRIVLKIRFNQVLVLLQVVDYFSLVIVALLIQPIFLTRFLFHRGLLLFRLFH